MTKQQIDTKEAPAAIGPYSQAIRSGNMIFFSGQIPLDPQTSVLVKGGIEEQTKQVMTNMEAVLRAAGCTFSDVIKTTVYLTDLNHFELVNEIYGRHFRANAPARACVQVAGLPKGALIEIDWIASASDR